MTTNMTLAPKKTSNDLQWQRELLNLPHNIRQAKLKLNVELKPLSAMIKE